MKKWINNIMNEFCYLENKDNYVSINQRINETALRLKINGDYQTFVVKGNHRSSINSLKSDLDILNWFLENTNEFWSNDTSILQNYINDNFTKRGE